VVKHLVGNEEIMGSIPIDGSIPITVHRLLDERIGRVAPRPLEVLRPMRLIRPQAIQTAPNLAIALRERCD
jgi:hypothetical protein